MIFRKLTAGFLAATAATALVACSSDSESDSADSAESAAPETQAEETSDAPASSELPTATPSMPSWLLQLTRLHRTKKGQDRSGRRDRTGAF